MVLGGPLPHVMAAKAVAFAEARQPVVRRLRVRDRRQRPGAGRGPAAPRRPPGDRRHQQPPRARWTWRASFGLTGRQAESALLDAGRRHQPQQRPARPQRRLVHLRDPARHPGADHARVRARRDGRDRRHHHHRAARHRPAAATAKAKYTLDDRGRGAVPRSAAPTCSAATRSTRASSCDGRAAPPGGTAACHRDRQHHRGLPLRRRNARGEQDEGQGELGQ